MRIFFAYLLNLFIFSTALLVLRENGYIKTYGLRLQNIYPIFETFFVSLFFYHLLHSKYKAWFIITGACSLTVFFLASFFSNTNDLPLFPWVLEEIFFLTIILFSFYEKLNRITESPIYAIPNFWISFGFLIYFAGTFFLYLVSISVPDKTTEYKQQFNLVVACFSIIKNTLFLIALYTNKQNELNNKKSIIPKFNFEDYQNPLPKSVIYTNK